MHQVNIASFWSFAEDDYDWLYILYEKYTENIFIWIQKLIKDAFLYENRYDLFDLMISVWLLKTYRWRIIYISS